MMAIWSEKNEMTQALIGNRVDVNAMDDFGRSPLAFSVKNGDVSLLQTLLDHDANPKVINGNKENLWHFLGGNSHPEEIGKILKKSIPQLINEEDKFGYTPLYNAVVDTSIESARVLLENGASLNKKGGKGTATDFAKAKLKEYQEFHDKENTPSSQINLREREKMVAFLESQI